MIQLITFLLIILVFGVTIFTTSLRSNLYDDPEFISSLLIELHGVFAESFLVIIVLGLVASTFQRYQNKKHLMKELDLLRGLRGSEAQNRVLNTIETLLKLGETNLNLANLDFTGNEIPSTFKKGWFFAKDRRVYPNGKEFWETCFKDARLWGISGMDYKNCAFHNCDFSNSRLIECNFSGSSFVLCTFENARVIDCDFTESTGITVTMLSKAETLYGSKFQDELEQELLLKKPYLLTEEPISDEERNRRQWKSYEAQGLVPRS